MYVKVAEAYIAGLEHSPRTAETSTAWPASPVSSSAALTRWLTPIDETKSHRKTAEEQAALRKLQGKVAIANGKITYQRYKQIFSGPRWTALADRGAQTQRVLWASTSTKNPAYQRYALR